MSHPIVFLFALLLTASFMWPSEGAIHGDGLHLAIGWLITGSCAGVAALRRPDKSCSLSRNVSMVDGLVIVLLVGGFWLSTWHVFRVNGDRRVALNIAFEWSAIGAVWWIVRRLLHDVSARQWIVTLLIGISVGAAFVGIVQHHVTHGRQAEWYLQQRVQADGVSIDALMASHELQRANIPLSGVARELFERRLLASSEPIGPFALANTLGGLLAVALVLMVGGMVQILRHQSVRVSPVSWAVAMIVCFVLGYCLLLTKSRTAWVGLVCGIGMILLHGRTALSSGRLKWLFCGATSLLAVGAAIGIGSGAIDKEVVLESPRSLQFRLFYWMGAAGVIADDPMFGSGPGNFRPVYLAHKVVESSEEILDPHNIVLDAWCSAGLIGVIAMCMMPLTVVQRFLTSQVDVASPASSQERTVISTVRLGIGCGLLLHLGWRWLNGGEFIDVSRDLLDPQNLVMAIPVTALLFFWAMSGRFNFSSNVIRAAFVCVFVHLLGAGGLQISGLGMLLALLYALSADGNSKVAEPLNEVARTFSVAVAFAVLAGATLWYGLLPVVAASRHSEVAAVLQLRRQHEAAVKAYDKSIAADKYNTDSRQRKMGVLAYMFKETVGEYAQLEDPEFEHMTDILTLFDRAIRACDEAIAGDQRSYAGYHFRSRLQGQLYTLQPQVDLSENAVKDMEHVISCYPENSMFWFEYAELLNRFERSQQAESAAVKALEIDAVNHDWGHVDRYLSDVQVHLLSKMVDSK